MTIHPQPHPDAGKVRKVRPEVMLYDHPRGRFVDGSQMEFTVEDWADRLLGRSWLDADLSNPAVRNHAQRALANDLPEDDEVVGGKADGLSHLVHVSELE